MGKLSIPTIGKKGNTEHPKVNAAIEALNTILGEENKVKGSGVEKETLPQSVFEKGVGAIKWYTPTIIAGQHSTGSSVYTPLLEPDQIESVVLPTNGLIAIGYLAKWKSTIAGAGRAAIHLGSTQVKNSTIAAFQEAETSGTALQTLSSTSFGLNAAGGEAAFTTTGQILSPGAAIGGFCLVFAAAGTYKVRVLYKAESGEVTAKERKLWVAALGV